MEIQRQGMYYDVISHYPFISISKRLEALSVLSCRLFALLIMIQLNMLIVLNICINNHTLQSLERLFNNLSFKPI